MFSQLIRVLYDSALAMHFSEEYAIIASESAAFIILLLFAVAVYYIANFILQRTIIAFIQRSESNLDDILVDNKVFSRASYFVPSYIISKLSPFTLPSFPQAFEVVQKMVEIYVIFVWMILLMAVITSLYDFYNSLDVSKNKPIKGFAQVLKMIVIIVGALMIIATLLGQNLANLVIGLGTLSAVLMLVFKDPILGFVGGLQLSLNDMVRIGDWISMPKYNADGDVLEITLTTVKVQNWDKTITTIPTYALVSDSFTNWRGMSESGGRRVKRFINLDMESVKFCTAEMMEKYANYQLISEYIHRVEEELKEFNLKNQINTSALVNGRRQTNLGIFRAYLKEYILSDERVHKDMTILVRHLQPSEKGIPIELYFFSNRLAWAEYEDLQSDIFDHVLAVIPMFDLKVFQVPTGKSIEEAVSMLQNKV